MKITIWYFSGSGTGANLAKNLYKRFQSQYDVDLMNVTSQAMRDRLNGNLDTDQLILILPVYADDAPFPLLDFLSDVYGNHVPVQVFSLWGKCHRGNSLLHIQEIFAKNGLYLNGAGEIATEHSFLMELPGVLSDETIDEIERYIVDHLDKKEPVELTLNKTPFASKLLCKFPQGTVARFGCKMLFREDQCNHCKMCIKMCPVGAIAEDYSMDAKKCIRCLACVTNCPKQARMYKSKKLTKVFLGKHVKENRNVGNRFY